MAELGSIDFDFGKAFAKAQQAVGVQLKLQGKVFISIKDSDKAMVVAPARKLADMNWEIIATSGTAAYLLDHGVPAARINRVSEGRPHCVDSLKNREIDMVFNTTFGAQSVKDSYSIRRTALVYNIAYFTTVAGMNAAVDAIECLRKENLDVKPLQEYYSTSSV